MCMSSQDVRSFHLNDLTPLFYAIARSTPSIGAITSFSNAAFDLYDLLSHLLKHDVKERPVIAKAAFSRFLSNMLLGFGNLAPFIPIAAIMTINPLIIPIIALHPVSINLKKNFHMVHVARQDVIEKKIIFMAHPTKQNLETLQNAKETLYAAKQELVISTGLVIGTAMAVVGVFFPPVLLLGIIFSVAVSVLGLLDKHYQFTKKIHRAIYGEDEDVVFFKHFSTPTPNTAYLHKGGLFSQSGSASPNNAKRDLKVSRHPLHI